MSLKFFILKAPIFQYMLYIFQKQIAFESIKIISDWLTYCLLLTA